MTVSVVVAEDHDLTRRGIRSLLENRLDAEVLATTGDGPRALPLVEAHRPDLLVLDLGLPHLNGLHVLQKVQKDSHPVQVVVLSKYADEAYVRKAFELGAAGYVLKGTPLEGLIEAVRSAVDGRKYLSSGLPDDRVDGVSSGERRADDRSARLTNRERVVLQLTAEGYSSREIGEVFNVRSGAVDAHRENVQAKLGLRNVVEMAAYAHQQELIPAPPEFKPERTDGEKV